MGRTLKEVAEYLGSSKQLVCNQTRRGMLQKLEDGTYSDDSVELYKLFHPVPKDTRKKSDKDRLKSTKKEPSWDDDLAFVMEFIKLLHPEGDNCVEKDVEKSEPQR